jgi:DNA-binding transcriptional LysR family regulator
MAIEIRLLQHALAVGRHGNFGRAAEALGMSQPSLSRSIAALEATLGVPLFDRSSTGTHPTAFGRVLLAQGEAVLEREAQLRREIGLLAGLDQGTLVVAAGPYQGEFTAARALARLVAAHPRLHVECRTLQVGAAVQDVLGGRADVGVANIAGLAEDERLAVEPLPAQRIVLACRPGHPLTGLPRPTLQQALQFPLVTTVLRGRPAAMASRLGDAPQPGDEQHPDYVPPYLVNSITSARLIARDSDALVPATKAMLADDLLSGRLVVLPIDGPELRTQHGLFYLRGRTLAPAARQFIDMLRNVETEAQRADPPAVSERPQSPAPAGRRMAGQPSPAASSPLN